MEVPSIPVQHLEQSRSRIRRLRGVGDGVHQPGFSPLPQLQRQSVSGEAVKGSRKDRNARTCHRQRRHRLSSGGFLHHARTEALLETESVKQGREGRGRFGRDHDKGFIRQIAESNLGPSGKFMIRRKKGEQFLFPPPRRRQTRGEPFRSHSHESGIELSTGESLELLGGKEVVQFEPDRVGRGRVYTKAGETVSSRYAFDAFPPKFAQFDRKKAFVF